MCVANRRLTARWKPLLRSILTVIALALLLQISTSHAALNQRFTHPTAQYWIDYDSNWTKQYSPRYVESVAVDDGEKVATMVIHSDNTNYTDVQLDVLLDTHLDKIVEYYFKNSSKHKVKNLKMINRAEAKMFGSRCVYQEMTFTDDGNFITRNNYYIRFHAAYGYGRIINVTYLLHSSLVNKYLSEFEEARKSMVIKNY